MAHDSGFPANRRRCDGCRPADQTFSKDPPARGVSRLFVTQK